MQGDAIRMTLLVTDVLEKMGISYAVGGSMSSSVHGIMRSTMDVDIVADVQLQHIPAFVAALSKEFYADDEMIRDAIEHHSSFNLIHLETAYKVDVFIPKQRVFDQLQLQRRMPSLIMTNPDRTVYVTSPEDIILSKLEWYRMGGEVSERQWRDILGVMKTRSGQLDLAYLRKLAKMLKVDDLFERILAESN
ncbi:MAG: hypothetical protein RBS68_15355 [Anaerolineales bacterium]|jgi:hypothetical protein|nr:hypothetical protein [Anaerolineales bacterium]